MCLRRVRRAWAGVWLLDGGMWSSQPQDPWRAAESGAAGAAGRRRLGAPADARQKNARPGGLRRQLLSKRADGATFDGNIVGKGLVPVDITCNAEQFTVGAKGKINLPTVGTAGDCLHDGLQKYSGGQKTDEGGARAASERELAPVPTAALESKPTAAQVQARVMVEG